MDAMNKGQVFSCFLSLIKDIFLLRFHGLVASYPASSMRWKFYPIQSRRIEYHCCRGAA